MNTDNASVKTGDVVADKLLLNRREAARLLNCCVNHLIHMEQLGVLPPVKRLGRRVLHSRQLLEEWAAGGGAF